MEGGRPKVLCTEPSQYAELGPYHWIGISPVPWWRSDPFTQARYDLPLSVISDALPLAGALGLDIGCGDGVMLHKVAAQGGSGIGLDIDRLALRYAAQRYTELHGTPPRLIQGSCYQIPLAGESVDFVVAIEVLQHLERPVTFLREAARVLRPAACSA